MAKIELKERALCMRKEGSSIGEIADVLGVSKSTASVWCRDISLTDEAMSRIAKKGREKSVLGLLNYSEKLRQKRKTETRNSYIEGKNKLGRLSDRDIYCIGLGLYWGEGYKNGNQEFGFTNSDPAMIAFYIKWLRVVFEVQNSDLIFRISINERHKSRIDEVESFWVNFLKVPASQFTKPSFIIAKSRKIYKDPSLHMGTLRVKVRKGTNMRRQIMGSIQSI